MAVQVPARVDEELAEAINASVKERGCKKNEWLVSAIRRELAADQLYDPESVPAPAPGTTEAVPVALLIESMMAVFKCLLALRGDDHLEDREANAIKDLFARCRAAIQPQRATPREAGE